MKIKIKYEMEFTVNPEWYPEGTTTEEMLAIEIANASNSPFEYMDENTLVVATGEIINE